MNFSSAIIYWYKEQNILLPWRGEKDLYKIWLSEVMLQQTQVKTVIPYYENWINKFPDIKSVSVASEKEILKAWEGLGFYSRARNFQHACKQIQSDHGGELPKSKKELTFSLLPKFCSINFLITFIEFKPLTK